MLTEQQKIDRRFGVGGSDIAILLGLSSYKTPYQLFLEKKGLLESSPETELQYWGNKLEPIIRDEFAFRNDVVVETPDTIVHPIHDFMRANIDGYIPSLDAILEVKCSNPFMRVEWGKEESDIIPLPYLCQVAYYCMCTNASMAYIAVLIGGCEYRQFRYERDTELEGMIFDAAKIFWNSVQASTEPGLKDFDDIKLKYAKENAGETKVADDKLISNIICYKSVTEKKKAIEKELDELKLEILKEIGSAESVIDMTQTTLATYKSTKRGSRSLLIK